MKRDKNFGEIYGCPFHGRCNGAEVFLQRTKNGIKIYRPGYKCNKCKCVYVEPVNGQPLGDEKHDVNGFKVWGMIGPFHVPDIVYIYCDKKRERVFVSVKEDSRRLLIF